MTKKKRKRLRRVLEKMEGGIRDQWQISMERKGPKLEAQCHLLVRWIIVMLIWVKLSSITEGTRFVSTMPRLIPYTWQGCNKGFANNVAGCETLISLKQNEFSDSAYLYCLHIFYWRLIFAVNCLREKGLVRTLLVICISFRAALVWGREKTLQFEYGAWLEGKWNMCFGFVLCLSPSLTLCFFCFFLHLFRKLDCNKLFLCIALFSRKI